MVHKAACNATPRTFSLSLFIIPFIHYSKESKTRPPSRSFARLKPLNVRFRSLCFIPFIHYLKECQAPTGCPHSHSCDKIYETYRQTENTLRPRLRKAGPTELSSDTKTPDDHRLLKATSGSLRSHKRTTSFTNTRYRLPLPRPTLGRGTPSPLYPRTSRIKDPKEGNKREGFAGHNLPSEYP